MRVASDGCVEANSGGFCRLSAPMRSQSFGASSGLKHAAAVHFGWAEADLAMLTLFGEPPPVFFAAYASESGDGDSWRERAALYNLYHLLNHLNLFGASYLGAVRAVLRRYG